MHIKTETKVGIFVILAIATFMVMILGIGVFRFNSSSYNEYTIEFRDVAGLSKKAGVKIAGVEVGWVNTIDLSHGSMQAKAKIMVNKRYKLYDNAYAVVRQEGLLGTKYLELIPGDPLLPELSAGSILAKTGRESVSVDELLYKFKNIAQNVEDVTHNLRYALVGDGRGDYLQNTVSNISLATEKINFLADSLQNVVNSNERNLNSIVENIHEFTSMLRSDIPLFIDKLGMASSSIVDIANEARDGLQSVTAVAGKIDEGKGFLGKLINDDSMYKDLQQTISGVKGYLSKYDDFGIIFDSHFEAMHRPVDDFEHADSKGYFNFRVHSGDDYFYIGQIVNSERGFVDRIYTYPMYFDEHFKELDYGSMIDTADASGFATYNKFSFAPMKIERVRKHYQVGFQLGRIYEDLAFRIGIMEGTFGAGVDYFLPIPNENFAWTTTFEAFDFRGSQRFDIADRRPHLKWLNRIFFFNNFYLTFGADDFVSKTNANGFWGLGLRFGDDDIKYLLSNFGIFIPT